MGISMNFLWPNWNDELEETTRAFTTSPVAKTGVNDNYYTVKVFTLVSY